MEAELVFMGQALLENRNRMLTDFQMASAAGTAEQCTVPVLELVKQIKEQSLHPKTLDEHRGYDIGDRVVALPWRGLASHVAQNTDGRATRYPGYAISQRIRKRVNAAPVWQGTR